MPPPLRIASGCCAHETLYVDSSPEAAIAGFERPAAHSRLDAATLTGRLTSTNADELATPAQVFNNPSVFPGPLVLPDDEIAQDPEDDDPQTFKEWFKYSRGPGRQITNRRKTLYVIPPPDETDEVQSLMKGWAEPQVPRGQKVPSLPSGQLAAPMVEDLCDYLRAFYHPMEIKVFRPQYLWRSWTGNGTSSGSSTARSSKSRKGHDTYLGLEPAAPTGELFGVRYRPSLDGIAKQQLNLSDITDAMLAHIPPDAYSVVMLTHHDLYEDDEDDFCCGRAWGSSRVAIVSSFRYHPSLDRYSGIDREHMWPASHCKAYVDKLCQATTEPPRKRAKKPKPPSVPTIPVGETSPLASAVRGASQHLVPRTAEDYSQLWMSRTARTMSHEVGHCMVLDHCSFFACVMQGTANIAEDVRQPPYLCPICLQKLSNLLAPLIGKPTTPNIQMQFIQGQHEALARFCRRWPKVGMFTGLAAWMAQRLELMQSHMASQETDAEEQPSPDDAKTTPRKPPTRATRQPKSTALFAEWLDEGAD
ncbi:unnamed protein product [Clonostachys byssicola]|uniref:Archaemetzincin-2 n=1 Tax=Clonostachys byssicola TaxID=160290 RepID=A0A9N9U2K3_9HYPO|nr:unnamed protein product [Clonostachys byssicola]